MLQVNSYDKKHPPKNIIAYVVPIEKKFKPTAKILGSVSYKSLEKGKPSECDEIEIGGKVKYQLAPRPLKEKERFVLFVAGESGAGKSHFTRDFAKYYHHMFPDNPIYLISYLEKDETLDEYDQVKRVKAFTVDFLDNCMKIDLEDLRDSLVIFDDIDSIHNKHVKDKIYGFLAKLLRVGRHQNISVIYSGHELYSEHNLKYILNESHTITWFPKFLNFKKSEYLLSEYFGLSKLQKEKISNIKDSRFITYMKGSDKIIMSEHDIFIL